MKPSAALDLNRDAIIKLVQTYKTANPRVFGSVVKNTDMESSDLDLLVDTLPGTTLFDLGGLKEALEDLLKVRVDLLTERDLPGAFRAKALAESKAI